jgi:hypothetical protein
MTIDQTALNAERLLTPDDLAKLVPSRRKGRNTSAQTIRRWMYSGLKGKFLPFIRVGSIPCSSESALMGFFGELTRDDETKRFHHVDGNVSPPTNHPKQATKRLKYYNTKADKLGL